MGGGGIALWGMRCLRECSRNRRFSFVSRRADPTCNSWMRQRRCLTAFFQSIGLFFIDSLQRMSLEERLVETIDLWLQNHLFCWVRKWSFIGYFRLVVEVRMRINNWMRVSCFICLLREYWIRKDPHFVQSLWRLVVLLCFLWRRCLRFLF
jgi:hypothetical protein